MEEKIGARTMTWVIITILLIVLSLIANVLLYTLQLRDKQDDAEAAGIRIYNGIMETQAYMNYMQESLNKLSMTDSDEAVRAVAGHVADAATFSNRIVLDLMQHADRLTADEGSSYKEAAAAYVRLFAGHMNQMAEGTGPLSEAEQSFIKEQAASFQRLEHILGGMPRNLGDNRNTMVRFSNGFEWLDLAIEIQREMNERLDTLLIMIE